MLKFKIYPGIALVLSLLLVGSGVVQAQQQLTVMSHDSFAVSKEVIDEFERLNDAEVRFLKAGDAGAALVQAILSRSNPMADIFYGVDNTFMSRALENDIFEPYNSPMLEMIKPQLQLDIENRLLPVDYGDVCLNYDKAWFAANDLEPPTDLDDLLLPEYKGLTVVQNPATSSPGLAFLLLTVGRYGEDGYLDYWRGLKENEVLVADGWEDAYFSHFTAASKGNRPIVVSYASSPPAAVFYAEQPMEEAPTKAIVSAGNAFRQIEFAGILKGTTNRELAEKFMDFLLGTRFQEDIPLRMFVFPANSSARLPELFVKHAEVAELPVVVDPEMIEQNRNQWIRDWTNAVLR